MKTFKIIGVRPLKGCNKHVIKNLKSDSFYTFSKFNVPKVKNNQGIYYHFH